MPTRSSIQYHPHSSPTPTETHHAAPRLRTVTGNRFPRPCGDRCGAWIPRDPAIRYVVDFGAPPPYPAYLAEHSPDYGSYRAPPTARDAAATRSGFAPASALLHGSEEDAEVPSVRRPRIEVPRTEAEAPSSSEGGRPWASGQLLFNAGAFESARSAFADCARDGETAEQLRARVNRALLEDLEQKVLVLRALHEKLREIDGGESFGDVVARSRPRFERM
ncbi:MAG: hypothetical protein ACYDFT_05990 [Thermoplasmata archaeon]